MTKSLLVVLLLAFSSVAVLGETYTVGVESFSSTDCSGTSIKYAAYEGVYNPASGGGTSISTVDLSCRTDALPPNIYGLSASCQFPQTASTINTAKLYTEAAGSSCSAGEYTSYQGTTCAAAIGPAPSTKSIRITCTSGAFLTASFSLALIAALLMANAAFTFGL